MAFSRGFVGNSNQLVGIMKNLLLEEGWQIVSTITEGRDYVFYSSGTDNNQDIYIRIAAGLYDFHTEGDVVQKPEEDGYSGFIDFFAYQYFPEDGDGYDGYNQIGLNGPALYLQENSNDIPLVEHNLVTATTGDNKKFIRIESSIDTGGSDFRLSDGRRRVYFDNSSNTLYIFSINRKPERIDSIGGIDPVTNLTQAEFFRDPFTDREFLLYWDFDEDLYALELGGFFSSTFISSTPFAAGFNSAILKGRKINGEQYYYMFQGNSPNWLSYNYNTATYSSFYPSPPDGIFGGNSSLIKPAFTYAPKEATGYDMDRIYSVPARFNSRFMSIAIGDDGEPVGGWITHTSVPGGTPNTSSIHCFADQNDPSNIFKNNGILYSTTITSTSDNLYFWKFPDSPTSGGSWSTYTNFFIPDDGDSALDPNSTTHLFNTRTSRLRVSESKENSYWVSVTPDRISVATKDEFGKYWYNYAGLFETLSEKSFATTSSDIGSGGVTVPVSDTSIFKIDENYQIIDTTGNGVKREDFITATSTDFILDYNANYASSETITVSDINPSASTITISAPLSRSYSAGSKVGEDPQPVMLRMQWSNEAATVNNIHLEEDHNSLDSLYQRYELSALISDSIPLDRAGGESAKEIYLNVEQTYGGAIESETRGRLIKAFYVSDTFDNESEIVVEGETYIAIAPSDQVNITTDRYLVGPVE